MATLAAVAFAQSFSADLVRSDAQGAGLAGRLRVAEQMVRLETPEALGGFFVVTGDASAAYFVKPDHRTYMEARQSSLLAQIFVPVDPDDPCAQWQKMATLSGAAANGGPWRCSSTGQELLGKRETVRYEAISPTRRVYAIWIDRRLKFPLRILLDDNTSYELHGLVEGAQPAVSFEIPAGYVKFDPQQLIERIKQSDVWVAPME